MSQPVSKPYSLYGDVVKPNLNKSREPSKYEHNSQANKKTRVDPLDFFTENNIKSTISVKHHVDMT